MDDADEARKPIPTEPLSVASRGRKWGTQEAEAIKDYLQLCWETSAGRVSVENLRSGCFKTVESDLFCYNLALVFHPLQYSIQRMNRPPLKCSACEALAVILWQPADTREKSRPYCSACLPRAREETALVMVPLLRR